MVLHTQKLSDGHTMPSIGLGLWKVTDETQFRQIFESAVAAGYRHFDSAQAYANEQFLGAAWRSSGLPREELFITTKIAVQNFGHAKVLHSFEESLHKLQTDHVDLLLLHFPGLPWLRRSSWRALEELKVAGKVTSIGVSNHGIKHLEAMKAYAKELPVVNQVEMHIFFQQRTMREYCKDHHIKLEAYSPLAHGHPMDEPIVQAIAQKHSKSYAQIMLRWCVEQGAVALPKSKTAKRIQENIDIFNFQLDDADRSQLQSLDRNLRTLWRSILFH
jgi:diketogulonate reductase-like aldo/keto reductase